MWQEFLFGGLMTANPPASLLVEFDHSPPRLFLKVSRGFGEVLHFLSVVGEMPHRRIGTQ